MTTRSPLTLPATTYTVPAAYWVHLFQDAPKPGDVRVLDAVRYEVVSVRKGRVAVNARKMRG